MSQRVKLPDGTYGMFPDNMSNEAIGTVLRKQFPPTAAPPPQQLPAQERENLSEGMSFGEKMAVGAGSSLTKIGHALSEPFVSQETRDSRKAEREMMASGPMSDLGAAGTIGEVGTDVGLSLLPGGAVLKGAGMLQKALAATKFARGAGAAAVGADVAGNAAVSAAMAPDDRDAAALFGGGGAAGGRVLSRTLGGALRGSVSPQAKTLMKEGIYVTPGQALTGPQAGIVARTIRGTEDKLTSMPLLGDVLKRARTASGESFNVNKINEALAPLGAKVKFAGVEGLAEADELISKSYNKALPDISVEPTRALARIEEAIDNAKKEIPFFDDIHQKAVDGFVERFVKPAMEEAQRNGTAMTGRAAKRLDSELGGLGRKYQLGGLGHAPVGDALFKVRDALRVSMEGATPEARDLLKAADAAYAKLLPLAEAGRRTASGTFTPRQLAEQLHRSGGEVDPVTQAAKQILPDTVPDLGTAGRGILAHMLQPTGVGAGVAGAAALAGFGNLASAAALASALYTKPGLKAATFGVHPALKKMSENPTVAALRNSKILRKVSGAPKPYNADEVEQVMRNLTGRSITESLE